MMSHYKALKTILFVMALVVMALTACAPSQSPPQITPTGAPINLGIASLDIINDYVSPKQKPHIDHIISPSPATQLSQWAQETLNPDDQKGNLLLSILDASMTQQDIQQQEENLNTLFTDQQRTLVRVQLKGILFFNHPDGRKSATLTIEASSEKSIADSTTPAQTDNIRTATIRDAIGVFDRELRTQLQNFNGNWPHS